MTNRLLSISFIGCVGMFDLYIYFTNPQAEGAWFWLIAGCVCIYGSAYIFSSKDD